MQAGLTLSGIIPGNQGGGGGGSVNSVLAENGLSLQPGHPDSDPVVVMGNDYGLPTSGQIAHLTNDREILLDQNRIFFSIENQSVLDGGRAIVFQTGIILQENSAGPDFGTYGPMYYIIEDSGTNTYATWQRRVGNNGYFLGSNGTVISGSNGFTWFDTTSNIQLGYYDATNTDNANNIFFYIYGDINGRGNMGIKTVNAIGANPVAPLVWDTVTHEVLQGGDVFYGAFNGTSINTSNGKVVLGNGYGLSTAAQTAVLTSLREILFNDHGIWYSLETASVADGGRYLAMVVNPYVTAGGGMYMEENTADPFFTSHGPIGYVINDSNTDFSWFTSRRKIDNVGFFSGVYRQSSGGLSTGFTFFDSNQSILVGDFTQTVNPNNIYFFVRGATDYPGNFGIHTVHNVGANPVANLVWDTVTGEVLQGSGGSSATANNGLSIDSGSGDVVWGNNTGINTAGQIAELLSDREVFFNEKYISFSVDNTSVSDGGRYTSIGYNNAAGVGYTGYIMVENSSSAAFTALGPMTFAIYDKHTTYYYFIYRNSSNDGYYSGNNTNGFQFYDSTNNIGVGDAGNADNANNIFFYVGGDITGRGNMGMKTVNAVGANPVANLVWDTVTGEILQGPGGGGGSSADNGLSVDSGTSYIVMGNDYGLNTAGQIGKLLSNREIFLNEYTIFYSVDNVSVADGGRSIVYSTGIYLDENSSSSLFTSNGAMFYSISDSGTNSSWITQRRQDNTGFFTGSQSGSLAAGYNGFTWYDATGNIQVGYLATSGTDNANNIFFYIYGTSAGRGNFGIKTVNSVGGNPVVPLVWDTVTGEVLQTTSGGGVTSVNGNNGVYVLNPSSSSPTAQLGGSFNTSQAVTAQLTGAREIYLNGQELVYSYDAAFVSGNTRSLNVGNFGTNTGIGITENITTFPSGRRIGYTLQAADKSNSSGWFRSTANTSFFFGTIVNSTATNGINFWDSGNTSVGGYNTDSDNGFFFQVKGTMSVNSLTPGTTPALANVQGMYWNSSTKQVIGGGASNGVSYAVVSGVPQTVLGNDVAASGNPAKLLSDRQIFTNGFSLAFSDTVNNNVTITEKTISLVGPTYTNNISESSMNIGDGSSNGLYAFNNMLLDDSSGNENLQTSTTIKLYNALSVTNYTQMQNLLLKMVDGTTYTSNYSNSLVDLENVSTHDYAHLSSITLQFSNSVAGGGTTLSKSYLAVNAPAAASTYGTCDIWGTITTDNASSPGSQSPVWNLGQHFTGGSNTVDLTQSVTLKIGGTLVKLACLN